VTGENNRLLKWPIGRKGVEMKKAINNPASGMKLGIIQIPMQIPVHLNPFLICGKSLAHPPHLGTIYQEERALRPSYYLSTKVSLYVPYHLVKPVSITSPFIQP
jgi:hypothetical protein